MDIGKGKSIKRSKEKYDAVRLLKLSAGLIIIITIIAYFPSLSNGFTNWDDDQYVVNNKLITELSFENIGKIFTTFQVGNYHPLTILSYAIEYNFFRLEPVYYHSTNLVLHILNSIFVFWLIYKIGKNQVVAFIAGVLFSIHPLHVESVAWISARKDVLYTFFSLGGLLYYVKYLEGDGEKKYYNRALLFFLLSCLSKAMAVIFPVILLLIDYYRTRKINRQTIKEKIPFLIISLIFGIVAILAQKTGGAIKDMPDYNFFDRLLVASYGMVFYIYKMFIPINLSCFYPYPVKIGNALPSIFIVTIVISVIIIGTVILSKKYTNKIIFGSTFFLISVLPVLQIIPVGSAIVADRYFYVSSIGPLYLIGEGIVYLYNQKFKTRKTGKIFLSVIIVLIIVLFSYLTFTRNQIWENSVSLYTDALSKYSQVAFLHNNMGLEYTEQGNYSKALEYFRKAAELKSNDPDPYINMADTYITLNQYDKAIESYQRVIALQPDAEIAFYNLGVLYSKVGKDSMGIICVKKAARLGHIQSQQWLYDNGFQW